MSAWWSKVDGIIEKHDGRKPKLEALIRINFAVNVGTAKVENAGLYRRDPVKNPEEPNILPDEMAKALRARGRR